MYSSYLLINVSLVSSSLFFKNLLPQRCFSISILSLYSLKVVLHFSHTILPKILFSIISLDTFKYRIKFIDWLSEFKINSKLLEIIGDYDWQSVEDYVDKNIDAYLN